MRNHVVVLALALLQTLVVMLVFTVIGEIASAVVMTLAIVVLGISDKIHKLEVRNVFLVVPIWMRKMMSGGGFNTFYCQCLDSVMLIMASSYILCMGWSVYVSVALAAYLLLVNMIIERLIINVTQHMLRNVGGGRLIFTL